MADDISGAFTQVGPQIDKDKLDLLHAIGTAGSAGRAAYEQGQQQLAAQRAAAADRSMALGSSAPSTLANVPQEFLGQLSARSTIPIDVQGVRLAAGRGLFEDALKSSQQRSSDYLREVQAAVPIAQAAAQAKLNAKNASKPADIAKQIFGLTAEQADKEQEAIAAEHERLAPKEAAVSQHETVQKQNLKDLQGMRDAEAAKLKKMGGTGAGGALKRVFTTGGGGGPLGVGPLPGRGQVAGDKRSAVQARIKRIDDAIAKIKSGSTTAAQTAATTQAEIAPSQQALQQREGAATSPLYKQARDYAIKSGLLTEGQAAGYITPQQEAAYRGASERLDIQGSPEYDRKIARSSGLKVTDIPTFRTTNAYKKATQAAELLRQQGQSFDALVNLLNTSKYTKGKDRTIRLILAEQRGKWVSGAYATNVLGTE
jgi:hypothetical protein